MKRIYALFFMAITFSATANPMFSDGTRNSVGIYLAQGTGQGDLGHLVFPMAILQTLIAVLIFWGWGLITVFDKKPPRWAVLFIL